MKKKHLSQLLVVILLALATGFAIASSPAGASADAEEADRKSYWQSRYSRVLTRASMAEARLETSRKALRKARQRDRFRGARRSEILSDLEEAEKEFAEANSVLVKFPESARRAGIPPGWLREVEDRLAHES